MRGYYHFDGNDGTNAAILQGVAAILSVYYEKHYYGVLSQAEVKSLLCAVLSSDDLKAWIAFRMMERLDAETSS